MEHKEYSHIFLSDMAERFMDAMGESDFKLTEHYKGEQYNHHFATVMEDGYQDSIQIQDGHAYDGYIPYHDGMIKFTREISLLSACADGFNVIKDSPDNEYGTDFNDFLEKQYHDFDGFVSEVTSRWGAYDLDDYVGSFLEDTGIEGAFLEYAREKSFSGTESYEMFFDFLNYHDYRAKYISNQLDFEGNRVMELTDRQGDVFYKTFLDYVDNDEDIDRDYKDIFVTFVKNGIEDGDGLEDYLEGHCDRILWDSFLEYCDDTCEEKYTCGITISFWNDRVKCEVWVNEDEYGRERGESYLLNTEDAFDGTVEDAWSKISWCVKDGLDLLEGAREL